MSEPNESSEFNPYAAPQAEPLKKIAPEPAAPPPIVAIGLLLAATDFVVSPLKAYALLTPGRLSALVSFDLFINAPWHFLNTYAEIGSIVFSMAAAYALLTRQPWAVRLGYVAGACTGITILDHAQLVSRLVSETIEFRLIDDSRMRDAVGAVVLRTALLGLYIGMLRKFPAYLHTHEQQRTVSSDVNLPP